MENKGLSRRNFLKLTAGSTVAAVTGVPIPQEPQPQEEPLPGKEIVPTNEDFWLKYIASLANGNQTETQVMIEQAGGKIPLEFERDSLSILKAHALEEWNDLTDDKEKQSEVQDVIEKIKQGDFAWFTESLRQVVRKQYPLRDGEGPYSWPNEYKMQFALGGGDAREVSEEQKALVTLLNMGKINSAILYLSQRETDKDVGDKYVDFAEALFISSYISELYDLGVSSEENTKDNFMNSPFSREIDRHAALRALFFSINVDQIKGDERTRSLAATLLFYLGYDKAYDDFARLVVESTDSDYLRLKEEMLSNYLQITKILSYDPINSENDEFDPNGNVHHKTPCGGYGSAVFWPGNVAGYDYESLQNVSGVLGGGAYRGNMYSVKEVFDLAEYRQFKVNLPEGIKEEDLDSLKFMNYGREAIIYEVYGYDANGSLPLSSLAIGQWDEQGNWSQNEVEPGVWMQGRDYYLTQEYFQLVSSFDIQGPQGTWRINVKDWEISFEKIEPQPIKLKTPEEIEAQNKRQIGEIRGLLNLKYNIDFSEDFLENVNPKHPALIGIRQTEQGFQWINGN